MTFEQFCKLHGLVTDADVLSHIHAGLRSAPTSKTYQRRFGKEWARLNKARDDSWSAYRTAIDAGEIEPPESLPREQRLRLAAAGHPDNASTQAAKRLLARMETT